MTENSKLGKFIVFEGPDGCGKTTQLKLIYQYIREQLAQEVIMTKEPGGTEISQKIREILLDPANDDLEDLAELLLYSASRAQHVKQLIKPNLAEGIHVLCDRFVDSTIAYQGYGRGLDIDLIKQLNVMSTEGLEPDFSFYIMVTPEVAKKRIAAKREFDRLEKNEVDFFQKLYEGYQQLLQADDSKYFVDGEQPVDRVHENIKTLIKKKI